MSKPTDSAGRGAVLGLLAGSAALAAGILALFRDDISAAIGLLLGG